jgi:pilus assembly protein CpaC
MLVCAFGTAAAEFKVIDVPAAETIHLNVGQTRILESDKPVKFENFRIVIENPEIAKADVLSYTDQFTNEIFITGKKPGITNLVLFRDRKVIDAYKLDVGYDVTGLKRKLHALLPEETGLKVLTTNETVTLAGKVSNAANLTIVMDVAKAFFPEEQIKNLVQVGGVHQVMLAVRIAEMQRSLGRRLGINFSYTRGRDFALSMLAGLTNADITENTIETTFSTAVNALFQFHRGSADWSFFLDALKSEGLVKILAEPNLISLSGQMANFLVGGEFPVPVPSGEENDEITIAWKRYGIQLDFTPIVLSDDKISLTVAPAVSDIDTTNALQLSGFFVPGVTTRRASTTVELGNGQSFAIAGLLRENIRNAYSKFPLLGDIPILGALFRSVEFQKNETELVIIITPYIVKPLDARDQMLPTDFYVEPDDSEFYIMGMMEGQPEGGELLERGKMDGPFGHDIPFPE